MSETTFIVEINAIALMLCIIMYGFASISHSHYVHKHSNLNCTARIGVLDIFHKTRNVLGSYYTEALCIDF